MNDRVLLFEDFADKLGRAFVIREQDLPAISLTLIEAELLPNRLKPGVRPPFSLIFVANTPQMLPQRLYHLEQEALGQITLFLVPVGKKPEGFEYQALFN